jgi:hypothetical protein
MSPQRRTLERPSLLRFRRNGGHDTRVPSRGRAPVQCLVVGWRSETRYAGAYGVSLGAGAVEPSPYEPAMVGGEDEYFEPFRGSRARATVRMTLAPKARAFKNVWAVPGGTLRDSSGPISDTTPPASMPIRPENQERLGLLTVHVPRRSSVTDGDRLFEAQTRTIRLCRRFEEADLRRWALELPISHEPYGRRKVMGEGAGGARCRSTRDAAAEASKDLPRRRSRARSWKAWGLRRPASEPRGWRARSARCRA